MTKIDPFAVAPSLLQGWTAFSQKLAGAVDPTIAELVKIRASQLNGCANCLNMHTAEARAAGETEQRLSLLAAWRDAPCYSERERAALAWAETLTRLADDHPDDTERAALAEHFDAAEQVALTLMIVVINGWNRLAVGFGFWVEPRIAKAA